METELLEDYKKRFEGCQDSLKLARKVVNKEFIEKTQPPLIVKEIKEKWFRFFQQKSFYKICHKCRGGCCMRSNYSSLSPIELLYIVANNPDFEFPEPDWKFLAREGTKRIRLYPSLVCLFLSRKGCLLKENKSGVCLFYVCSDISSLNPDSKILNLRWADAKKMSRELDLWYRRISNLFHIVPTRGYNGITCGSIILDQGALEDLLKRR